MITSYKSIDSGSIAALFFDVEHDSDQRDDGWDESEILAMGK